MDEFIADRYGEDAAKALEKHLNQVDEVTKKEIKITGDLAWAQTMDKNGDCTCDGESRRTCRCTRTKEFKQRAKAIRALVFPESWEADPFKLIAENMEEGDSTEG